MSVSNVTGTAGGYRVGSRGMTTALKRGPQLINKSGFVLFDEVKCGRGIRHEPDIGMFECTESGSFMVHFIVGVIAAGPISTVILGSEKPLVNAETELFVGTRVDVLHLKEGESFFFELIAEEDIVFTVSGNEHFTRAHICYVTV